MPKPKSMMTDGGFMRIKKGVGNVLGAIMSRSDKARGEDADRDRATLKEANRYKGAPNYNDDGSVTDAFKARSAANEVTRRRTGKARPFN